MEGLFSTWQKYFCYDERSPSYLSNRVDRGKKAKKDAQAGHIMRKYYRVRVDNVTRDVHKIVWEIHNGKVEKGFLIDHIDGNPLNNDIRNLRSVTPAVSARNRGKYLNNTSGTTGVHYYEKDGNTYVCAQYYDLLGKRHRKNFSVRKLGIIIAGNLAAKWREMNIELLNLQGAGYTERYKGPNECFQSE